MLKHNLLTILPVGIASASHFSDNQFEQVHIPHTINPYDPVVYYVYQTMIEFGAWPQAPQAMHRAILTKHIASGQHAEFVDQVISAHFSRWGSDSTSGHSVVSPNIKNVMGFEFFNLQTERYFASGDALLQSYPMMMIGANKVDFLEQALFPMVLSLTLREEMTYGKLMQIVKPPAAFANPSDQIPSPLHNLINFVSFKICTLPQIPRMS
jgi:hypothetical protein